MSDDNIPLSVTSLNVKMGHEKILDDINIADIAVSQITAFAGPNGAGKSTLLKAIAGVAPASGIVSWLGENLLDKTIEQRSHIIGYMPQAINSASHLTVLESLVASLRFMSPEIARNICEETAIRTLDELGLLRLAMKHITQLSGGERQLTSLAQSLVRDPKILLLDEPTSALDLRHQIEVMTILRSLADRGKIVITVLHDLTLAANWSDKLVFIANGKTVTAGAPRDVLTSTLLADIYGIEAEVDYSKNGKAHLNIQGIIA